MSALLCCATVTAQERAKDSPRIVNIINFIRELEPRDKRITEDVLRNTVERQIDQLNEHKLPATFLLQYDALIDLRYKKLFDEKLGKDSEIGAWWEITQPHVEAAGMKWRGRFPWDWHADVGFATGYTPAEREKLVDVYMAKFKDTFGYYPKSVGSWFIDAHTLGYMHKKYGIVASCNCKDQYGTDGYTLWGGYWNQAYYPSRKNAFMPAQNAAAQIPVPIFRMLGSDPIYQYDDSLGASRQGVISLEPVYPRAGGDVKWVEWFFRSIFEEPSLTFNYAQVGQENSFTWGAMEKGLNIQIPRLAKLAREGKIRVETLETSGGWFKKNFKVTPPTAVTALSDPRDEGNKTVWFNSRFYRANLLWQKDGFRFHDMHLFDERMESDYLTKAGTSNQCVYRTLPVMDGYLWSERNERSGLYLLREKSSGGWEEIVLRDPEVTEPTSTTLRIRCQANAEEIFTITFLEDRFEVQREGGSGKWVLASKVPAAKQGDAAMFGKISGNQIKGSFNGINYKLVCTQGTPMKQAGALFAIAPKANKIAVDCSRR